jgi:hypothetical protein
VDEKRVQKSADELAVGDWLAPDQITDGAAEVLHALTYPAEGSTHVHVVVREQCKVAPYVDVLSGSGLVELATEADLAELREQAERTQKIADLRQAVDFLDERPWLPLPDVHVHVHLHNLDGYRLVQELAKREGVELDTTLDDRTKLDLRTGAIYYSAIAWHEDGRPAELKPLVDPDASMEAHYDAEAQVQAPHPSWPTQAELKPWESLASSAAVLAESMEPIADPTGLAYTRADDEPDDPTPVTGARVAPHVGSAISGIATDGHRDGEPSQLIDELDKQIPAPTAPISHEHVGGSAGGPGENSAECACGVVFDGFDSPAEVNRALDLHIEVATSATGLTKAADESRGPLAFTTPVVTYFSFGHGQSDPDSGKSLLDHYVTVVAPTYEACREAMFASRFGREWSFDYLAGTKRATEWMPRWTEHEVIVAPGTDPAGVETALVAAADLLLVGE